MPSNSMGVAVTVNVPDGGPALNRAALGHGPRRAEMAMARHVGDAQNLSSGSRVIWSLDPPARSYL